MSLRVRVTTTDVPDALASLPLSIEIVPAEGRPSRRSLVPGTEGGVFDVEKSGRYTVRAELPSGGVATAEIEVTEGDAPAEAVLSLGRSEPTRSLGDPPDGSRADSFSAILASRMLPLARFGAAWRSYAKESFAADPQEELQIRAGFLVGWFGSKLAIRPVELDAYEIPLPGVLKQAHPGMEDYAPVSQPLLCVFERGRSRSLAVWPPTPDQAMLSLSPDPSDDSGGLSILAMTEVADPRFDALLAYALGGALDAARSTIDALLSDEAASSRVLSKNPTLAAAAAYALLKAAPDRSAEWIADLARCPHIPDGAVVYAWQLIHRDAPGAADWLLAALNRGVPMFSAGVQLLKTGLAFVSGLHPEDDTLRAAAERAALLASLANPDSEVTTLKGDDQLEFIWLP